VRDKITHTLSTSNIHTFYVLSIDYPYLKVLWRSTSHKSIIEAALAAS
jgi:hypothetical protein